MSGCKVSLTRLRLWQGSWSHLFHVSSPNSVSSCFSWPFYQEDLKGTWQQTKRPPFVMALRTHRLSDPHSMGLSPQRNGHLYVFPHSCFPHRAEIEILILKYKYFPSFPVQSHLLTWRSFLWSVSHWFEHRLEQNQGKRPLETIFCVLINPLTNVL